MVDRHAYKDHSINFEDFFLFKLPYFTFLMLPRVCFKTESNESSMQRNEANLCASW